MSYTLRNVYNEVRAAFREKGLETANVDARILICHYAEISKEDFVANDTLEITSGKYAAIVLAMQERLAFKPISKIIGYKEFYGRKFIVTQDTLDPRPETELIVDAVLQGTGKHDAFTFCDIGTGTGCIALSILAERPNAIGFATDISLNALTVAKENANKLELRQ